MTLLREEDHAFLSETKKRRVISGIDPGAEEDRVHSAERWHEFLDRTRGLYNTPDRSGMRTNYTKAGRQETRPIAGFGKSERQIAAKIRSLATRKLKEEARVRGTLKLRLFARDPEAKANIERRRLRADHDAITGRLMRHDSELDDDTPEERAARRKREKEIAAALQRHIEVTQNVNKEYQAAVRRQIERGLRPAPTSTVRVVNRGKTGRGTTERTVTSGKTHIGRNDPTDTGHPFTRGVVADLINHSVDPKPGGTMNKTPEASTPGREGRPGKIDMSVAGGAGSDDPHKRKPVSRATGRIVNGMQEIDINGEKYHV